MNHCSDFRYDLEVGQVAERELARIFADCKVEVKRDLRATETGNVFVEFESRGKPSGLATTEADQWCFEISNHQRILIDTDKLKEKCRPYVNTWRDRAGGDENTSRGILLPIGELIK